MKMFLDRERKEAIVEEGEAYALVRESQTWIGGECGKNYLLEIRGGTLLRLRRATSSGLFGKGTEDWF